MRITVVIPTYNRAELLPKAIQSVLAQTRMPDEILIIDDGSTDATPSLVPSWPPPVRYLRKTNGGVSSARNLGIREATGDWIAFLDSDDWWAPGKLEAQLAALQADPTARFCYTGGWNVWPDGRAVQYDVRPPSELWPAFWHANQVNGSSILAHRQTLLDAGLFDESMRTCEDWDLWVRVHRLVPFVSLAEPYVYTLQQPASLSMDVGRLLSDSQIMRDKLTRSVSPAPLRLYRRRAMEAVQLFHAAMIERERGQARHLWRLLQSIERMPLPTFMPVRFRAFAVGILRTLSGRLR